MNRAAPINASVQPARTITPVNDGDTPPSANKPADQMLSSDRSDRHLADYFRSIDTPPHGFLDDREILTECRVADFFPILIAVPANCFYLELKSRLIFLIYLIQIWLQNNFIVETCLTRDLKIFSFAISFNRPASIAGSFLFSSKYNSLRTIPFAWASFLLLFLFTMIIANYVTTNLALWL